MENDLPFTIWNNVLLALLFFLPAYIANMAPVILWRTGWWKALRVPIDFGVEWRGIRLFGANKTFFGLLSAILGGALGGAIMFFLMGGVLDSGILWWVLLGGAMGLGAILGDLLESFFKRRLKIKPGAPLIFWDQVDFVIGAWVMYQLINKILPFTINMGLIEVSVWTLVIGLILTPGLHLVANIAAYKMGWKKVWW